MRGASISGGGQRWPLPPREDFPARVDRTAAYWAIAAAVAWTGMFSIVCLLQICTLRFYDLTFGGPEVRRWVAWTNGAFAAWLLLHLAPLVVRRIRQDSPLRVSLVGSIALVATVHLMIVTFGLLEATFPPSELSRGVALYCKRNEEYRVQVEPEEFDPVADRLRADIRAAGGRTAPHEIWILAEIGQPPALRFRTFTVTLKDRRVDVNGRDFGPLGHRIAIRFGAVFVDGEHRGSFLD